MDTKSKNVQGKISVPCVCVEAALTEKTEFMGQEMYRLTILIDEATKNQIESDCMEAMKAKGLSPVKKIKAVGGQEVETSCWKSPCYSGNDDDGTYIVYIKSKFKPSSVWDLTEKPARKLKSVEEINAIQWVGGTVKITYSIFASKSQDGNVYTSVKFLQVCYAGESETSVGGSCAFDSVSNDEPCAF